MKMPFYKYQGAGNDFVIVDQRLHYYLSRDNTEKIRSLCDRRFGIGADGLMLLQNREGYDFEMVYFNADGREGSMCGNGGRCIAAFAHHLGVIGEYGRFMAVDGEHEAWIKTPNWVELHMQDVRTVEKGADYYYLNTGSPHYIRFVEALPAVDVVGEGRKVRYSDRFCQEGTNVNFVQVEPDGGIAVATYERGVEDETLACGTGVTAAAIAYYLQRDGGEAREIPIKAKGGDLSVRFEVKDGHFYNIWLCGPAERVFEGSIEI
jgi:diaminopimelate epimerase